MDKLRVGILGLRRGRTHLRNFLAVEEAVVIGAAERLEEHRELHREAIEGQGGTVVAEYEELLAMKPDAVVVATNGKLQARHSCQALEADCAVLSEIPGAYTFDEVVQLRNTVEKTGGYYMAGENACFWDFFRYWRKWVRDDRLGFVSLAEGEYLHYLPAMVQTATGERMKPSEAREQGLREVVPVWRADQPPIQYLTHDLGPLLEVLDDRCVSVSCRSAAWRSPETPLRSDGQFALFETARGTLIRILVTLSTREPGAHRYRLLGVSGSAEWFSDLGGARLFDRDRAESEGWLKHDLGYAAKDQDTSTGHGGADLKMARVFTRALLAGDPPPIDVYRGVEYCLPGIIANQSAELGGAPLPIPDLRRTPFTGTAFWDYVDLPDHEPPEPAEG